jgi:hypothetical protein
MYRPETKTEKKMQAATEWAVFTPYRKTHSLKHEMTQYQY